MMTEWVIEYLGALGMGGLFIGLVIEALGVPFPGGLMIILAGFLVNQGKFNFYNVLLVVILGFNMGAMIAYLIGKYVGEPFLFRFGKYLRVTPNRIRQAQEWLEHSSAAFIIFGRFIPMISNLTPYMAGMSKLSILKFISYNFIFTMAWSLFNLGVGMFFSYNWNYLLHFIRFRLPLFSAGLLILCLLLLYLKPIHKAKVLLKRVNGK